jgi:hypothetical protein
MTSYYSVLDEVVKNLRDKYVNLMHAYLALPYIIVVHLVFVIVTTLIEIP